MKRWDDVVFWTVWLLAMISATTWAQEPTEVGEYVERFRAVASRELGFNFPFEMIRGRVQFRVARLSTHPLNDRIRAGTCVGSVDRRGKYCQRPTVYIDRDTWARASDLYRELLVFHELGHCFLFRKHSGSSLNIWNLRITASLMHPQGPDMQTYFVDRRRYHEELFRDFKDELARRQ